MWYLSSFLAIAANVGFGASVVAMNAYLPSLAQTAPDVVDLRRQLEDYDASGAGIWNGIDIDTNVDSPSAPLLQNSIQNVSDKRKEMEVQYQAVLARETSRISSLGIALGYVAGILLLVVALVPVTKLNGSTFALRLAIGLSGVWWALFTIPAALFLSSSPTEYREEDIVGKKDWNVGTQITSAWIRLVNTFRWTEIKKLRNTFKFLAAWFLLSDGKINIKSLNDVNPHFLQIRIYNNYFHRPTIRQNDITHVIFGSYPCWCDLASFRYHWLLGLAHRPAKISMVISKNTRHPRRYG